MIRYLRIVDSISSVGDKLNLQGKEMVIKGDTTYLESKGWITVRTRNQILDNYRVEDVHSILVPMLSNPPQEPSYEQKLMDEVAKNVLCSEYMLNYPDTTFEEKVEDSYNMAKIFINQRQKYLL